MTRQTTPANPSTRLCRVLALGAAGGLILLCGCQKTALRPDDPRSQFEHYDASRNRHEPAFIEDEFGQRLPNLRGRLLVRD